MILLKTTILKVYHALLFSPFFATIALIFDPLAVLVREQGSFILMLTVMIMLDLIIGAFKYLKLSRFCFRSLLTGLIIKVAVSYGGLMLFMAFSSLEDGPIVDWFMLIAKFTILLYPAGSTLANMYILTGGKFPPIKLMKYLEAFDQLSVPMTQTLEDYVNHNKDK